MEFLIDAIKQLYDVEGLIRWGGYLILLTIVFAETGLLVGFFLPGDSLLVAAGLAASQGLLEIWTLCLLLTTASISGNSFGYFIGRKAGPALFNKKDSLLFSKANVQKAQVFYEKNGGKAIILAQFIPIVRTFTPVVAGITQMDYRRFLPYSVIGAFVWVWPLSMGAYFLGKTIPDFEKNIHYAIGIVILVSLLPIVFEFFKARAEKKAEVQPVVVPRSSK
ncbi:MAG: VTT domain-containing protein [Gloeobacterales cyanobacterium]